MRLCFAACACACALVAAAGCNKRVFEKVEPACTGDVVSTIDVPTARAADVLIVVDNSGSMQEEQSELARNFVNPACPLTALSAIPDRYVNPSPALYAPGGELAECGFIQLLAAFDNDFRVGVVTTDVSLRDGNDRPQRGCLQPDGAARKVIARADVLDDDAGNDDLAERFSQTLAQISVFGTPVERGLDAAALFLDPGTAERGEGCDDDLGQFRRDDAQLVVLFLSDEEDCSHALGDSEFGEELADELADGVDRDAPQGTTAPRCYSDVRDLSDVSAYAKEIKGHDKRAKVAVIAGALIDDGDVEGADCRIVAGEPEGGCWGSHGFSIYDDEGYVCGPSIERAFTIDEAQFDSAVAGRGCTEGGDGIARDCERPCCVADAGTRYVDFAREFVDDQGTESYFVDSICKTSYRDTMIELASFIASVDFVKLARQPKSEDLIIVTIVRAGEDDPERILRIDAEDCLEEEGWYYDPEEVQLVFCGKSRPRPGDQLDVRAAGKIESDQCGG